MTALTMTVFGDDAIEWKGALGDDDTHVMVATRGAAWSFLCRALPRDYVTWPPNVTAPKEEPTTVPVVWRHDRAKVTCESCLAVLDGAVVERKELCNCDGP